MTDKTGIYLHTITMKILADTPDISGSTLDDIHYEMTYGEFMGTFDVTDISEELSREELTKECNLMGGDVDFFLGED